MTCPTCHAPARIVWRSTAAGLAVEGCAGCHERWRRLVLGGLVEEASRLHAEAVLRGEVCSGPCAACDAERRAA